jgi:hypothetical protein
MLAEMARRIGWHTEFAYRGPAEIFREHAALSAFENAEPHRRIFDIGALCDLSDEEYDRLPPSIGLCHEAPRNPGRAPSGCLEMEQGLPPRTAGRVSCRQRIDRRRWWPMSVGPYF